MEAKVKQVLSGDTLILHNVKNPSQERTLSLAFVSAPRLRREGDEVSRYESTPHIYLIKVVMLTYAPTAFRIRISRFPPQALCRESGPIQHSLQHPYAITSRLRNCHAAKWSTAARFDCP